MLSTTQGMAIRFPESQLREQGRNTRGVRGIKLRDGDEVCSMLIVDEEGSIRIHVQMLYHYSTFEAVKVREEEEKNDFNSIKRKFITLRKSYCNILLF